MKRITVTLLLIFLVCMVFCAMEAENKKIAFNHLYQYVKNNVDQESRLTKYRIASEKAIEIINKENKLEFIRTKYIVKKEREELKRKQEEEAEIKRIEANRAPNYPGGGHLTPSSGVYYYGNQRETYYNLDMSWVVSYAKYNGIPGEYWVRSDGCKMLGNYIILACNRDVHPYGSIVETSLGLGISLDTGGFAYDYPYGVDIAVNW